MSALSTEQIQIFRKKLGQWYRANARTLPWRGVESPYLVWVSEIMLQQTRVNAVLEHYHRFVEKFPTAIALALAPEEDVLAAWSGLGYYRRARMLHRAAKFLVQELNGELPHTAAELRRLPGIGGYTSAAIASIAFGESIAVVDGNVERVLLRVTGRPEDTSASGRDFIQKQAQALVPLRNAGDHNQAMMELGATICTPKSPKCTACPVFDICQTRGEHITAPRPAMLSRNIAYGVWTRPSGTSIDVLMKKRAANESLMAGMLELPQLAEGERGEGSPLLRVRHSITKTNYYVEVWEMHTPPPRGKGITWVRSKRLPLLPLTGLAKKILERMGVMEAPISAIKRTKR